METPREFVAVTEKVYAVPLVKPETIHEVETVVHVSESGDDVTVYEETAAPLATAADHETSA